MRFAKFVDRIGGKGAAAWAVHQEAVRQRAQGRDIIMLTVGDPDQDPPPPVIEAAVAALRAHRTGYAPIPGYPELRDAVAARFRRRTGSPCNPENVVIVPGAQAGLYTALQCLAGPGDEVVVPEPVYATYEAVVGASGAAMINVPLHAARGFHPDIEEVARAITPRTRVLWINSPHNPTGAVLTRAEVEAIAALCRQHDLWLLSDEVYETLAYGAPHVSPWSLPGMAERTVVVSSLSKSHAIPGFRFGWVIAPPDLIEHLSNLILCLLYGGPPFIQAGALEALIRELPEETAMREIYFGRSRRMAALLAAAPGCRVVPPDGGMFLMLDISGTGRSADTFARGLLDAEAAAVLPCDGFGPSAAGHLRVSLTQPDAVLEEAGRRVVRFAETLRATAG
jgi:arginine:pyruvate transaminase